MFEKGLEEMGCDTDGEFFFEVCNVSSFYDSKHYIIIVVTFARKPLPKNCILLDPLGKILLQR